MTNFTKIQEGNVTLIHHSTASLIEIVLLDKEDPENPTSVWFDYYEWADLLKIINKITDNK